MLTIYLVLGVLVAAACIYRDMADKNGTFTWAKGHRLEDAWVATVIVLAWPPLVAAFIAREHSRKGR